MRAAITLVSLVTLLALLAGCPGKVEFSELDKFGSVRSAVWLDLTVEDPEGERTSHVLVLNSKPGLGKAYQDALPELATYNERIWDLWLEYYDDYYYYDYPDYTEWCQVYSEYWGFMADSFDKFYGPGARSMSLYLTEVDSNGDSEWNVAPEDGTWDGMPAWEDRDSGRYFDMTVAYYNDNPFRIVADRYSDIDPDYGCFGYGDDYYDDMMDSVDYYYLDEGDGSAEITMKALNKAKVAVTGGIVDEDQNRSGSIDSSFTATRCQVTIETDAYFYLYWYF
jgi:hypothetical protein